ncbi:MAG TPA: MoaD/ThiS family protein [Syntrophales bacterium]|nr:MoaD/ThiS family protein [Syntrophales bacterium]
MKVELILFASLARFAPVKAGSHGNHVLDIDEGTTVMELIKSQRIPVEKIRMIFLNGLHATGEEVLKNGDRVGVFPPVAGG